MAERERPLPRPDLDAARFWASCAEGAMELQRCEACGSFRYPPGPVCPSCLDDRSAWTRVSGVGTVYVALTVARAPHPAWAEEVPYNISLVDLPEGVRMWGNVVGRAPEDVRIGDRVRLRYAEVGAGITLPRWEVEPA